MYSRISPAHFFKSLFLHICYLFYSLYHVAVKQLHHLGLAVPLKVLPGEGLEGPSSSVVRDPAVYSLPLARYTDLEMRVKKSLIKI